MKVRDIMRPARWTVSPDDTLGKAERMMAHRRLHQLLVVDAGALAGLISERDILDYRASPRTEEDWWRIPVRRAMAGIPATAAPDETVAAAIDRLAKSPVDVLPIVEQGFLLGQLTATDLFEAERFPAEPARRPLTAADAMSEPAVSVRPSDSLIEAARLMVDHQVRHLPVVDHGTVVGMLSDRDIRTLAGDPVRFVDTHEEDELAVRDAMSPVALTVHANRPLRDVATELADEKVGALPIVDLDGKLVGIVSYVDALRALVA